MTPARRLILMTACALTMGVTPAAWAEDGAAITASAIDPQAPLRLGLLDVTTRQSDSERVLKEVGKALRARDDLARVSDDAVRAGMQEHGLDEATLRTSSGRKASREAIAELMASQDLELLLVVDAYGKGKNLQIVMFGRDGRPVDELKRKLKKRRRLSKREQDQAVDFVMSSGGDAVMAQREAEVQREREAREAAEREHAAQQAAEREIDQEETGAADPPSARGPGPGDRPGGFQMGVGVSAGARLVALENDAFAAEQTVPLIGPQLQVGFGVPLAKDRLVIGLSARGGYAPLRVNSSTLQGETTRLSGNFAEAAAQLDVDVWLGKKIELGLDAGAELSSLVLEENPLYTGHRYVWARAGGALVFKPVPSVRLKAHGAALPVLQALTSGGAYGDAESTVGLEVGGELAVRFGERVGMALGFRRLAWSQPYSGGSDAFQEVKDTFHRGHLLVVFAF